MKIDLNNLNPGTWFTIEGGGQVCVRVCAGGDYQAIYRQVVTIRSEIVFDSKTRQAQRLREEIIDHELLKHLLWDFCIVDWKDMYDGHERPIPCTKEMKILLMDGYPKLSNFISACIDRLREMETKEAEGLEKNLSAGWSG